MSTLPDLLGDTTARDYSHKLRLFNAFADPELRQITASLNLTPKAHVLDAGCGTGEALRWLADEVGYRDRSGGGTRERLAADAGAEAALLKAPSRGERFGLIWCMNTIHHLRDPVAGARQLASLSCPTGRTVLCQSSVLPGMYFAWDARLEHLANEAVRQYYRDRHGVNGRDLVAVRSMISVLRQAQLRNVRAQTFVIERISPLGPADETYLYRGNFP